MNIRDDYKFGRWTVDKWAVSDLLETILCNRKYLEDDDKKKAHFQPKKGS